PALGLQPILVALHVLTDIPLATLTTTLSKFTVAISLVTSGDLTSTMPIQLIGTYSCWQNLKIPPEHHNPLRLRRKSKSILRTMWIVGSSSVAADSWIIRIIQIRKPRVSMGLEMVLNRARALSREP